MHADIDGYGYRLPFRTFVCPNNTVVIVSNCCGIFFAEFPFKVFVFRYTGLPSRRIRYFSWTSLFRYRKFCIVVFLCINVRYFRSLLYNLVTTYSFSSFLVPLPPSHSPLLPLAAFLTLTLEIILSGILLGIFDIETVKVAVTKFRSFNSRHWMNGPYH